MNLKRPEVDAEIIKKAAELTAKSVSNASEQGIKMSDEQYINCRNYVNCGGFATQHSEYCAECLDEQTEFEELKAKRCTCWDDMLEKLKEQIMPQIPEGSTDIEIRWDNSVWVLSNRDIPPVSPKLLTEYREPKRGGGHRRNLTKKENFIVCKYCTFCGRKYETEEGAK